MFNPLFRHVLFLPAAACLLLALPGTAQASPATYDDSSAVILAYQRIGEELYPANDIGTEQFQAQIDELAGGDYHVVSLSEAVGAFKNDGRLPDKTVVITFDGAYRSAFENAIPLLLEKKLPFTVFVAPGQADSGTSDYMTWDQIKKLARNPLVTIGLHPNDYTRLSDSAPEQIRGEVNKALVRYRDMLRSEPKFFAYPFGEYSKAYREAVANSGFMAAFGQQSGVAYAGSDMMALPRFAITEGYGDNDRFRMIAAALPLPLTDLSPDDPHMTPGDTPPAFGFTIDPILTDNIPQLSCYISGQEKPKMQVVGKNRIELRARKNFDGDRARLNCTMPGPKPKPGEDQRWRWFGLLLSIEHQNAPVTNPADQPD